MGISASHQIPLPEVPKIPPEAYICKYSKDEFNQLLNIIRDCHNVSQYYSTYLLMEKVPVQLPEYKNYSDESENYFNKTRKELIPDLGMSYYAFYNYITALPRIYESTESAYIVQKTFIEDLWKTCNIQGGMTIEEIQGLSQ
jgi:hypothetical protein